MYDTRLVVAAQEGDDAAFAALYDRHAETVYDFCWALAGDEQEASRMVEDAFVLAARHIDDVTDASQVRPWLLAIARDRALADDEAGELHTAWGARPAFGAGQDTLGTGDLRRWAREAGATLALADQAVLELSARHDLDPDQLACAIGCEPAQLDAVVSQVDHEADEVLGALVVARQGRKDCAELAALLGDWDGAPAVEVAEQTSGHIPGCEKCTRRLALLEPRRLVATAPRAALPTALRGTVLDAVAVELAAAAGRRAAGQPSPAALALEEAEAEEAAMAAAPATAALPAAAAAAAATAGGLAAASGAAAGAPAAGAAGGGVAVAAAPRAPAAAPPTPPPGPLPDSKEGPPWMVIAAATLAVAVLIAIVALAVRGSPKASLSTVSATTVPPSTVAAPPSTAAVAETLVPLPTSTTGITTTTIPATGHLQLDSTTVDLGSSSTSASVLLSNSGPGPVAWRASVGPKWLSVSPSAGTLRPNSSLTVTVAVDRATAPGGTFSVQVAFVATGSGSVGAVLTVSGSQTAQTTTTAEATTSTSAAGPTSTTATTIPTSTTVEH
jgi:DNA-directed RNA polymerase specialized sigma24 family protein